MTEKLIRPLTLEEIIEKYPAQDNLTEAIDPATKTKRFIFSRVHRDGDRNIVYVVPYSIRWTDDASS